MIKQDNLSESKIALVYGQMNEPPGARLRVALSGLAITEYFRDEKNQDVLLFIDNIFRFSQAGSEVSALLGRTPSAVGYQPTLAAEMGDLQERITSTKKGSIRRHDCPRALDRRVGDLPRRGPAVLDLARAGARNRGQRALRCRPGRPARVAALQGSAGHYRDSGHGRVVARRQADGLPRAKNPTVPQPAF